MHVLDIFDLSLWTSLDKLVEQPESRIFYIASPDILGDVLSSMIGTVKRACVGKYFFNWFNQTLCLIRDKSVSLVVEARKKVAIVHWEHVKHKKSCWQLVRVLNSTYLWRWKKIAFRVTLLKIIPSERAGCDREKTIQVWMVIFILQFREVFEERFELSFREVFERQIYSWWDTRTQVLLSEVIRMHKFI